MYRLIASCVLTLVILFCKAGDTARLYNPAANATEEIAKAVKQAKKKINLY